MSNYIAKFLRQRQMMTVMPILCYPFLCLFFWSLGGGKGAAKQVVEKAQTGINTSVPQASNNQQMPGRLSLYELADQDSARIKELQRLEARRLGLDTFDRSADYLNTASPESGGIYTSTGSRSATDPNEEKVARKLSQLQAQLDQASTGTVANGPRGLSMGGSPDSALGNIRLMMDQAAASPPDPELTTINQMLATIRDIQNHGTEVAKVKQQSSLDRSRVFTVAAGADDQTVQSFGPVASVVTDTPAGITGNHATSFSISAASHRAGFYNLEDSDRERGQNTVGAIVFKSATVVSDATLQLMLTDDIYLAGRLIPKGTFVFGTVKISNERVLVSVRTIQYDKSLFPVNLDVYGLDGQEGIPAPGAITQDASSQGMDNAMQLMNMSSMDPNIGAQAASAGIQTAKTLLSRKVKMVKANVRGGDAVLLVDAKTQQMQ